MGQRTAAKSDHSGSGSNINQLSWDYIRIFLACAEANSFRKAAQNLKTSSSTIVRRIEKLETLLEVQLFKRLPNGILITQEGRSILDSAREMETAMFDVLRKKNMPDEQGRGVVSISITEGLGAYWLTPKLVDFHRQHPFMIIDLNCAMNSVDVLRMEADISIQFERPTSPDLIVRKLGCLHVYPFASRRYLETYGTPESIKDMAHHSLVDQISSQLQQGAWRHYLGIDDIDDIDDIICMRTNSSSALFYAVEQGAGIGALPTYAIALDAPVLPVDIGLHHQMDIWLTYHPDIRKTPRHAIVIDWLVEIFNPAHYPWFRDEFIHPNELVEIAPLDTGINSVKGFFAATPFKQ